jgi:hypothetical protein
MKQILMCALLTWSLNAMAQAPRLLFQKGKGLEVTTKMETSNKAEFMGQTMETKGTTTITQKFDVENATDTAATIEQKIKALQFNMEGGMGQNFSFNSEKPEDMKGEIGQMMEETMKAKYKYRVNSKGIITYVEEQKQKSSDKDDMMAGLLSQMNGGAQAPKVGDRIAFSILPDRELKQGDSWIDEAKGETGTRKATYTVKQITDLDIILNALEESTINTKQSMMGMEATVSGSTRSTGEIIVDKKTGMVRQSTSTVQGEQTMEMQGQKIPTSSKMTITTTIKPS